MAGRAAVAAVSRALPLWLPTALHVSTRELVTPLHYSRFQEFLKPLQNVGKMSVLGFFKKYRGKWGIGGGILAGWWAGGGWVVGGGWCGGGIYNIYSIYTVPLSGCLQRCTFLTPAGTGPKNGWPCGPAYKPGLPTALQQLTVLLIVTCIFEAGNEVHSLNLPLQRSTFLCVCVSCCRFSHPAYSPPAGKCAQESWAFAVRRPRSALWPGI